MAIENVVLVTINLLIARKIHLLDFKYSLTLNAMIANSQELGLKQFIVPEAKWRDYGFCVKS